MRTLADGGEDGLDGGGSSVDVELKNILARHRLGAGEIEDKSVRVDYVGSRCVDRLGFKQGPDSRVPGFRRRFGWTQSSVDL